MKCNIKTLAIFLIKVIYSLQFNLGIMKKNGSLQRGAVEGQ
jgi:hypothetical protein